MSKEVEDVERAGLAAFHAAAPASAIVANRTIGLGLDGPETREIVEYVTALYRDAGVARYFVHVCPESEPPDLRRWLATAGLEKARGWMKFARGREALPEIRGTDLTVHRAEPADAPAFGRIVADAFDLGPELADWVACLVGAEGWHIYMSFDGDTPAGTGGLFVEGDIAYCDWGATAPAYRQRGSQSALLHRRVAEALDMGCRRIVTETSPSPPLRPAPANS